MGAKSKYIGMIFDGRWEVKERMVTKGGHGMFRLVNIYNQSEIFVSDTILKKVVDGKLTVSRIISSRMLKQQINTLFKQ